MEVPADTTNAFDLDADYTSVLLHHLTHEAGMEHVVLHLGEADGDLLKAPLESLDKRADFLVAGPPCPPWSGCGSHTGLKDARAQVFLRVLEWVFYFAKCGGLLGCILENVVGIKTEKNGFESAADKFLRSLRKYIPEFSWDVRLCMLWII